MRDIIKDSPRLRSALTLLYNTYGVMASILAILFAALAVLEYARLNTIEAYAAALVSILFIVSSQLKDLSERLDPPNWFKYLGR